MIQRCTFGQGKRLKPLLLILLALAAVPFSELATAATRAPKEKAMPASNRDWKSIKGDSKEKYNLYLCSREWAVLKEAVRERSGGVCERCKRNPMQACHHLTYENKYAEELEDLQAICQGCHDFTHGKSDVDPSKLKSVTTFEDYADLVMEKGWWPAPWALVSGSTGLHPLVRIVWSELQHFNEVVSSTTLSLEASGQAVPQSLRDYWMLCWGRSIQDIQKKCLKCDVIYWHSYRHVEVTWEIYYEVVHDKHGIEEASALDLDWGIKNSGE